MLFSLAKAEAVRQHRVTEAVDVLVLCYDWADADIVREIVFRRVHVLVDLHGHLKGVCGCVRRGGGGGRVWGQTPPSPPTLSTHTASWRSPDGGRNRRHCRTLQRADGA